MRFKQVEIQGAIPFPHPTVVKFPEEFRTVALVGDNGAGKSTVFDAIFAALYGERTKPTSLYELFKDRNDGVIDFTFEMNGHEYRVRRFINGVSRSQKAWFYVDGQPVNEGKVSEFEAVINKYVGINKATFLATVYNSQTEKGNPLNLDDEGRRKLLSDVLGLNKFDPYFEKAGKERLAQEKAIEQMTTQIKTLIEGVVPAKQLEAELAIHQQTLEGLEKNRVTFRDAIDAAKQRVADARANGQNVLELQQRIAHSENDIQNERGMIVELEKKIAANLTLKEGSSAVTAAVIERNALNAQIKDIDSKVIFFNAEIEKIEAFKAERVHQIDFDLQKKREEARRLNLLSVGSKEAVKTAKWNIEKLEASLANARSRGAVMGTVPCDTMDIQPLCPFMTEAVGAAASIPELEQQLAAAKIQVDELDKELANWTGLLTQEETKIREAEGNLQAVRNEQPAAEQRQNVKALTETRQQAVQQLEEAEKLAKQEPFIKDIDERVQGYRDTIQSHNERIELEAKSIEEKRLKIADAEALATTIKESEDLVAKLEADLTVLDSNERLANQAIGELNAKIEHGRAQDAQINLLNLKVEDGNRRLAYLKILEEGLGPKGAKALKIDASVKAIEEIINSLLMECFGPQFTILIKTLKTLTSGEERESVQFSIIDNESGEETVVENKSGGEQQLIKEVISLGFCIMQKLNHAHDIRTIIRDECCSALTEENSVRYVKMLRKACDLGGFDQVLFVSHKSCAQDMADHLIDIDQVKGQAEKEVHAANRGVTPWAFSQESEGSAA